MRSLLIASLCLLGLVCFASACSAPASNKATTGPVSYTDEAQTAYEKALVSFRKGDCISAEPLFQKVVREFPYSRFSALSELRVADCQYKADNHSAAIQAYRQFVRQRPSHSQTSYARFRIAKAYYKQIPGGWALAPPPYERDQGAARDALSQLRRFVVDYPDDDRVEEAHEMVQRCLKLLAEHELVVANFYMKRKAHAAVVSRLKSLLSTYQGSGLEPKAMWMLSKAYIKLKNQSEARETLQELVDSYPESKEASKAKARLRTLPGADPA